MNQTFEDFLMEKHAEQHTGTKHTLVDDFLGWSMSLDVEEFMKFGDLFAKEQSKDLLEACKEAIKHLHIIKPLNMLKQAIKKTEGAK